MNKTILDLFEPWSNAACKGYAAAAMRAQGLPPETIRTVLRQMSQEFDATDLQAAADYYNRSGWR